MRDSARARSPALAATCISDVKLQLCSSGIWGRFPAGGKGVVVDVIVAVGKRDEAGGDGGAFLTELFPVRQRLPQKTSSVSNMTTTDSSSKAAEVGSHENAIDKIKPISAAAASHLVMLF